MYDIKKVTQICKEHRINNIKITQKQLAEIYDFDRTNIMNFENGRNRNLDIFLFYVDHGLDMTRIKEVLKNG